MSLWAESEMIMRLSVRHDFGHEVMTPFQISEDSRSKCVVNTLKSVTASIRAVVKMKKPVTRNLTKRPNSANTGLFKIQTRPKQPFTRKLTDRAFYSKRRSLPHLLTKRWS